VTLIDTGIELDIDLRDPEVEPAEPSIETQAEESVSPRRRIGRRAVPVAFWVLTFALIALLFLPTALGYSRYAITGGSMSPTFDKGSAVFERPVPVADLAVGDVITYVPPADSGVQTLVTHRIVDISRSEAGAPLFRTKGDANEGVDPWDFTLTADEQNVVEFAVPHLGTALTRLSDPSFRRLLIGIPAGIIALRALAELVGWRGLSGWRAAPRPPRPASAPCRPPAAP
jgi:signal peptidase